MPNSGLPSAACFGEDVAERPGVVHPLAEGADAGEDDAVRRVEVGGVGGDLDRGVGAFEPARDAAEVPQPVVDDDHLGGGLFSLPYSHIAPIGVRCFASAWL